MNCSRFLITVVFLLWTSILCFAQDTINRPSICLSLGYEGVSMQHNFTGTVNTRFKTPIGATLKASLYVRSLKGRSVKVDMGLLQYSSGYITNNYPSFEIYGGYADYLLEELRYLRFLNTNVLAGRRCNLTIANKNRLLVIPIDVYGGLNFQFPLNQDEHLFYTSTPERRSRDGDSVYRESKTVRALLPRLSLQVVKEFKLSGNVNWYLGLHWVQGFAPFLQKNWWIESQGRQHDHLGIKHTGTYVGFELGIRGLL